MPRRGTARMAPGRVRAGPARPASAAHLRKPPQMAAQRRMPMHDRLRRTLSWEPSAPPHRRRPDSAAATPASLAPTASAETLSGGADAPDTKERKGGFDAHILRLNKAREISARKNDAHLRGQGAFSR